MSALRSESHAARPVRVAVAGWLSITMGVLAVLASLGLAVMVLVNTMGLEVAPGTPAGLYRLLLVVMMVGGILIGLVVVLLGRSVLRGSLRGRFALLALWIVVGGAAFFGVGLFEASLPVLMVMAASVAVTVLLSSRRAFAWFAALNGDSELIGVEARARVDSAGTRGVIALVAVLLGLSMAVYVELVASAEESFLVGMALEPFFVAYNVGVLWFAMRALGRDGTRRWASSAVAVAIAMPLAVSTVGLIDAMAS